MEALWLVLRMYDVGNNLCSGIKSIYMLLVELLSELKGVRISGLR